MASNFLTTEEFIEEFRRSIGDQTCEIPARSIIAWINVTLRRLARAKGLDVLFRYQDTFELASLRTDGAPATTWSLRGFSDGEVGDEASIGTIIDVESLLFLEASDRNVEQKKLCYLPPEVFRSQYPFPANGDCLSAFTVNEFGGTTKLTFNAPIEGHVVVDMVYTAFHPRIKKASDIIRVPYAYLDILLEGVKIAQNEEASDFATARALLENWDYLIAEARELLHQQKKTLPLRQVRGSF